MSRNKGKRGERELAAFIRAEGFDAARGVQYKGTPGSPDVACPALPGLHLEVKRCESLSLYRALEQAISDAGGKMPLVAHRRNDCEWVAILRMTDLLSILRESTYHKPTEIISTGYPQDCA